jgi:hypothetical protein
MMIATTGSAAIIERARSRVFRARLCAGRVELGHDTTSLNSITSGSAPFGKRQSLTVGGITKQASFLERIGSLRPGRHLARFLKGIRRACILATAVRRGFLLHDHIHILVWRLDSAVLQARLKRRFPTLCSLP